MDTDLMRASGLDPNRQESCKRKRFDPRRFRRGGLRSSGAARYLFAVTRVTTEGSLEMETFRNRPIDQRQVAFFDQAAGELDGQGVMGGLVFGDNDEPRCPPVQTVDDAGSGNVTDATQVRAMVK
jgi:hypothetical protein